MEALRVALALADLGVPAIPVLPLTKTPAVRWKRFQTETPPAAALRRWFAGSRHNLALVTRGLLVYDVDDVTKAGLVLRSCGDAPVKTATPRGGVHLVYRIAPGEDPSPRVRINGVGIDVRAGLKSIMLYPPSRTGDGAYRHLGKPLHALGILGELPTTSIAWTQGTARQAVRSIVEPANPSVLLRRAAAWLACVEGAVSGSRGHDRLFRVRCRLLHPPPRGFGLTREQAWPLVLAYNSVCEPEFSVRELTHKCDDALKKV